MVVLLQLDNELLVKLADLLIVHKFEKTRKKRVQLLSLSDIKVCYFTELFRNRAVNVVSDALLPDGFYYRTEVLGKILLVTQKVKSANWV